MTRWIKKAAVTFAASTALLLAVCAAWPVLVLEVSLPKKGNQFVTGLRVNVGDPVLIQYRHSVELTQVEGLFAIGPESELMAVETRFESIGTGLPTSSPDRTMRRKGWGVVDENYRPVGPLRFYISSINKARLCAAGHDLSIGGLDSGTLVQIRSYKTVQILWMLRLRSAAA